MSILNMTMLILSGSFFLIFSLFSFYEKEFRAAVISLLFSAASAVVWSSFLIFSHIPLVSIVNKGCLAASCLLMILSMIRYFPKRAEREEEKVTRFDERDHMFSRMNMGKFPEIAEKYYRSHPDKEPVDKRIAGDPPLGEPGSKYYDRYYSPVANAAFVYLDRTSGARAGSAAAPGEIPDKNEVTRVIRWVAEYYGAADLGITELKDHHFYSHHGRKADHWGDPVPIDHRYGIVIAVNMDVDMMARSPALPVILESSRQYVESARIAHLIAEYIRQLGYDATAHVDGNYDILAVPMARDAGLGEVGRMGILIHRRSGPAVRLSAVTTNIPLVVSERQDHHIEEFCAICRKCAVNCPTASIPAGEKPESRNVRHWSIDQQTCYAFWRKIGTDCGFCIRVCPYTKKDTLIHRMARAYISMNPVNQRIALMMDDIFYGKKFRLHRSQGDVVPVHRVG